MTDLRSLQALIQQLPRYQPQDVAKEYGARGHKPASPLVGVWRDEPYAVVKWSDLAAALVLLQGSETQPDLVKLAADIDEIRGAYGYLLMQIALTSDSSLFEIGQEWLADLQTLESIYNRDTIAQELASQIEAIFDKWLSHE